jgi:hypothetical protein
MAAQSVAPEFEKHAKRARELNDREKKDVYHHPTERGILKKSIDLASPKPMSRPDGAPEAPSRARWIDAYLILEARRNNWTLQFGEKHYGVRYSQGEERRSRLDYVPCGARQYSAVYPGAGRNNAGLRYIECGKGKYKAEYAQNADIKDGLGYVECEKEHYKAQFARSGGRRSGIHYLMCGQKQYRLLCSQLDFGRRTRRAGNGRERLDLLMYDEGARNLVILELQSRRNLPAGIEELEANREAVRDSAADIRRAFDLDEIRGIAGCIVAPSNGRKGTATTLRRELGKYGLIEYPDVSKPWEDFSKAKQKGKNLRMKFTCRKLAEPVPLR